MGYNTDLEGVLTFKNEMTIEQLKELQKFLGENPDNHKDWIRPAKNSYIQFEITDDYSGLKWDGNEKFYYIPEAVNIILDNMRIKFPDFELEGEMLAQGEEILDRWKLVIEDGRAVRKDIPFNGKVISCPDCGHDFILETD